MTDREAQASTFISRTGWASAQRRVVAGDASNRRYDRLREASGKTAILMDAPPEKGENVRPFVSIAGYLRGVGLSAPKVLAEDPNNGFLLLEDLGDAVFARIIEDAPELESTLYQAAIDVLTALHHQTPPALEIYSAPIMTDLAALSFDWYQKGVLGSVDTDVRQEFCRLFQDLLAPLDRQSQVLVQRDYHAENLIWLPDRTGPARVGLLDFQDAMLGHPAYDLVSILQDARRDVAVEIEQMMITRYLDQNPQSAEGFASAYALLGVQRNLRILGVFARLCMRDGKPHYLDLIPRVWGHVLTGLNSPVLEPVSALITNSLPAPTPAILERLRLQCAKHQTL